MDALLFATRDGNPYHRANLRRVFKKAAETAGVPVGVVSHVAAHVRDAAIRVGEEPEALLPDGMGEPPEHFDALAVEPESDGTVSVARAR